jgi:hypothetical protein
MGLDFLPKLFCIFGGLMTGTYVYRLLRSGELTRHWELKQKLLEQTLHVRKSAAFADALETDHRLAVKRR